MNNNEVFQVNQELNRLKIQNNLLKTYEQPIYDRMIADRFNLFVLDIGCNNGSKQWIGLEYLKELAAAQEAYGNDCVAFYQCDVEAANQRAKQSVRSTQRVKIYQVNGIGDEGLASVPDELIFFPCPMEAQVRIIDEKTVTEQKVKVHITADSKKENYF